MQAANAQPKAPWIAVWSTSTVAILGIDFWSPNVDLVPLVVVPLLGIAELVKLRVSIALAIAFACAGTVIEAISDHRTTTALSLAVNAAVLAGGYVVAVVLFTCLRSLIGESRSLYEAVKALRLQTPRLFPQAGAETLGWRISLLDARRPQTCHEFHHISSDADGCELIVGDVMARGLNDVMILSTIRGAISSRIERKPALRLGELNERLLHVADAFSSCAAWCAFLDPAGVLQLACSGHGPLVIQRSDGTIETIDGGGRPLGLLPNLQASERLLFLEQGECVLIAGDGLMSTIKQGTMTLREVVQHPELTAEKMRAFAPSSDAFGIIIERCATGPIERLVKTVRADSWRF